MAIELPIEMDAARRWHVDEDGHLVFENGAPYDGPILTVEVRDETDAIKIFEKMLALGMTSGASPPAPAPEADPDITSEDTP